MIATDNRPPDTTTSAVSIYDGYDGTPESKVQPREPRKSKAALRQVRHQKPKRKGKGR